MVSVIIPVKNRATLLRKTLRNILDQRVDKEVIVVDDHSSDDLMSVLSEFGDLITVVVNDGVGPGAARNTGLRLSSGDFIQFFDSDDLMTNDKLSNQLTVLMNGDADFVYSPYVKAVETADGWVQCDVFMQYFPVLNKQPLVDYVLEGWCPITQSCLFRRSLVEKAGYWREDLMPHEDYEYWFRLAKHTKKFSHEQSSCVIYRQHGLQITDKTVSHIDRWKDGLKAMEIVETQIDFEPNWKSRLLFMGRKGLSKNAFNKRFGNKSDRYNISLSERFQLFATIFFQKLGRINTRSSWQPMHGVLRDGAKEFEQVVLKLK